MTWCLRSWNIIVWIIKLFYILVLGLKLQFLMFSLLFNAVIISRSSSGFTSPSWICLYYDLSFARSRTKLARFEVKIQSVSLYRAVAVRENVWKPLKLGLISGCINQIPKSEISLTANELFFVFLQIFYIILSRHALYKWRIYNIIS